MQYSISGEIAQSVRLAAPGESAWGSKGVLMAYSSHMQWRLRVPSGTGGALRRSLSGEGLALTFLETKAEDQYALLAANEELLVSTGNLAAFSADVDYDIRGVGGFRRMIFGGEGLFMTNLRGPGRVLLQTLKRNAGAKSTG